MFHYSNDLEEEMKIESCPAKDNNKNNSVSYSR
jgi:hypothetical protein